ncbi:hypothetical protein IQ07DRAFT_658384 [Pyrenochaeta sp. DS3sAY3a]|nr:hypothetical protein IQ07DRAFT_658384 [Pyrenochaeta sp. DS3sAY3a]
MNANSTVTGVDPTNQSSDATNDTPTRYIEIAPDGDFFLALLSAKHHLKVNSHILGNASKPFKDLFSPFFQDGQTLAPGEPKTIPLPDDVWGVHIICSHIHCRNELVPVHMGPRQILEAAIATHKWGCMNAMQFPFAKWLNPAGEKDMSTLACLMVSAYILSQPEAFRVITLAMMEHAEGSFCPYALYINTINNTINTVVPKDVVWRIMFYLEDSRSKLYAQLGQILEFGRADAGQDPENCLCQWSARHSAAYSRLLASQGLGPAQMHGISVHNLYKKIDSLSSFPLVLRYCANGAHKNPQYNENRDRRLASLSTRSDGLCLDCILKEVTGQTGDCRIHPAEFVLQHTDMA